jgi:hypothetical protein
MTTLKIEQAFEPVEVDLWGHEFHTLPLTRSRNLEYQATQQRLAAAENDDDVVEAIAAAFDVRLKISDGKRTQPSKLILDKWNGDELTLDQLFGFLHTLGDARPT